MPLTVLAGPGGFHLPAPGQQPQPLVAVRPFASAPAVAEEEGEGGGAETDRSAAPPGHPPLTQAGSNRSLFESALDVGLGTRPLLLPSPAEIEEATALHLAAMEAAAAAAPGKAAPPPEPQPQPPARVPQLAVAQPPAPVYGRGAAAPAPASAATSEDDDASVVSNENDFSAGALPVARPLPAAAEKAAPAAPAASAAVSQLYGAGELTPDFPPTLRQCLRAVTALASEHLRVLPLRRLVPEDAHVRLEALAMLGAWGRLVNPAGKRRRGLKAAAAAAGGDGAPPPTPGPSSLSEELRIDDATHTSLLANIDAICRHFAAGLSAAYGGPGAAGPAGGDPIPGVHPVDEAYVVALCDAAMDSLVYTQVALAVSAPAAEALLGELLAVRLSKA